MKQRIKELIAMYRKMIEIEGRLSLPVRKALKNVVEDLENIIKDY